MATEAKEKQSSVAKGFQPLGDRVFVTYTEEMERTAGGIYVPESAKENPNAAASRRSARMGRT